MFWMSCSCRVGKNPGIETKCLKKRLRISRTPDPPLRTKLCHLRRGRLSDNHKTLEACLVWPGGLAEDHRTLWWMEEEMVGKPDEVYRCILAPLIECFCGEFSVAASIHPVLPTTSTSQPPCQDWQTRSTCPISTSEDKRTVHKVHKHADQWVAPIIPIPPIHKTCVINDWFCDFVRGIFKNF